MKKIIIYSFCLFSVAALITACKKDSTGNLPELTRFPLPLVVKVAGSHQVISAQDPNSFSGKFSVGLYFPNDAPPKKFDVVVIKNEECLPTQTCRDDYDVIYGDVTLEYALQKIVLQQDNLSDIAKNMLQQLRDTKHG